MKKYAGPNEVWIGKADDSDVADNVVRFVEKLKLPRFKLASKKRPETFLHI